MDAHGGRSGRVVQAGWGHGSIATSQRYVERRADLGRQAAAAGRAFADRELRAV